MVNGFAPGIVGVMRQKKNKSGFLVTESLIVYAKR